VSWEGLTPPYATIVADPPWQFDHNGGSVELFARRPRLGWDHWGHGYEGQAA